MFSYEKSETKESLLRQGISIDKTMKSQYRESLFYIMIVCAIVESVLFFWLCFLREEAFIEFVTAADTRSYDLIARHLVQHGTLVESPRTLGYPLFLSLGYLIGGIGYGKHVVIAMQLLLNLIFTWGCWHLLQRLTPATGTRLKTIITFVFFWAGMGLALSLMADFLTGFFLGVFLYGLLFWRSRWSVLLAGTSLALATLARPTFTFIPLLLPVAGYLVGRCTAKIPWSHLAIYIVCSLIATGISITYQYSYDKYTGPSSIVAKNIGRILHYAYQGKEITKEGYERFQKEIAEYAGQPYVSISRREEERYAMQLFFEKLRSHPQPLLLALFTTCVKYLFAPIEQGVAKLTTFYASTSVYLTYVRPLLAAACFPIWFLAMSPPIGSSKKKAYYLFIMIFLLYMVGITAANPWQGERIRFPVLAFMLPVVVWNFQTVCGYMSQNRCSHSVP
jgi:hypothetical protein